jgi:fatty-acid peroxygenase
MGTSREWSDPWSFDPSRFLEIDPCDVPHFVTQGGGPRETGHRCPGEGVANALIAVAVSELARLDPELPMQDMKYSMRRMPTRPVTGVELTPDTCRRPLALVREPRSRMLAPKTRSTAHTGA